MESQIRLIRFDDNPAVAQIIRMVMPEFGADGKGFAIHDNEVDAMYETYTKPRSRYFVCELNGEVVGGGGVAPLEGGDESICELKKMYFLPISRGSGLGSKLLEHCFGAAKEFGYDTCYLETFHTMTQAMKLYEKSGFAKIEGPLGSTGHFGCDTFYCKPL